MLNWIADNKEWLFSGIGVTIILLIGGFLVRRFRGWKSPEPAQLHAGETLATPQNTGSLSPGAIIDTIEWEVVGRPYTTNGGKNAHVRVQRANQPGVTEVRMWGAYEVSVKRAGV